MRSFLKFIAGAAVVLVVWGVLFAVSYGLSYKLVANETPWSLCVQQTSTYASKTEAEAALEQYFPILRDETGAYDIGKTTFDDFRFVGDTTIVYGTHDCSWWEHSFVPKWDQHRVVYLALYLSSAILCLISVAVLLMPDGKDTADKKPAVDTSSP